MTVLLMLRSAAKESLRPQRQGHFGAQSHTPRNSCVRFAAGVAAGLAQHSPPGGLLGLTCAGLSPADRASFLAHPLRRVGEDVAILAPHRPGRADFPHPVPHVERFAAAAYRWTIMARGSGWRSRNTLTRAHVSRSARVRRSSHFRHSLMTCWRYRLTCQMFPVRP